MAQDDNDTLCSAGGSKHLTRRIIDRDIAQLEERIRALKSRRNELCPICCLPPEILCSIFSFIPMYFASHLNRPLASWISFSQVSRRWRSLALNAPELWTIIPLRNPRWAQEMLTRSKMAKLTIRVDLSYVGTNCEVFETIRTCLSHMKHVGEIDICGAGTVLKKTFQNLPKSAPQLHTLRIAGPVPQTANFTTFTLHQDLLCDTERLQCVDLVNCKISWDSRLLTGLTHLTLYRSLTDEANSSIIQFLHALQRMPGLTNLDLQDSIPPDTEGLSTYPTVNLPCLRVLRISSDVGALTTALRHIAFPSSVMLNVICKVARPARLNFSNFFSVLATKFLSSLVIRSLFLHHFDSSTQDGLRFLVSTTAMIGGRLPSKSAQLILALTWPSSLPPHKLLKYTKALTSALDAMSLHALAELNLATLDHIDSKTLLKTFGKLPLLERVHVMDLATQPLLVALVYKLKAANRSKTAYRNVSFPKLRYLHLYDTDFEAGSMSVDMLIECLMERCERDAAVHELHLNDCYNILRCEVEELEEIVDDVIWDGVEQRHSTEYSDSE